MVAFIEFVLSKSVDKTMCRKNLATWALCDLVEK